MCSPNPSYSQSSDDGKTQAKGVMSFIVMEQSFRVPAEILGLQIHVQAFSQKMAHWIGQI